jgi:acetyl-CoA acyltransferase
MTTAVIVDAVRSPLGRRGGLLAATHPADLAAQVLARLVERHDLDPELVDDVLLGCATQVGAQAVNIARTAVLAAGFPESVPATTIGRQCGSSLQAIAFAVHGVLAGAYDVVLAGGVESMSTVPTGADIAQREHGQPFSPRLRDRYLQLDGGVRLLPQAIAAEALAERYGIDRDDCDALALASHERAGRAQSEGRSTRELVPVDAAAGVGTTTVAVDEGPRAGCTLEALARLKPAFRDGGVVTAGTSAQIGDGAAAVLLMEEEQAAARGLVPRARVHATAVVGVDAVDQLTGAAAATHKVLERAKLGLDDLDVVEVDETFAPVVLAWAAEHPLDRERLNPNGGALALGHPLGASSARLLATLLGELDRTGGRYGLLTASEGGGHAGALVVERLG